MEEVIRCSVVVPVYNSEDCLEELSRRIDGVMRGINGSYELVLVDDHSRDNSWRKIGELAGRNPSIIGISFRKNFGQDNALMAGIRSARGRYIIIMDDDLQHDPAYIPELMAEIEKGHDVVYARYAVKKQKAWKNLGSWFNGRVAEKVLGKPRNVYLSPYKIIRSEVAKEICTYEGPYPYIDGLLFRVTGNFSQIDVEHRDRFRGTSTYSFWKSVAVWSYLATNFSILPLRLATITGLFTALSGAGLGLFFLVERLLHPQFHPAGWASLIVSVLTFGGIQLISIGLVGEYIGRAYLNINRQPQYVIRDITPPKR